LPLPAAAVSCVAVSMEGLVHAAAYHQHRRLAHAQCRRCAFGAYGGTFRLLRSGRSSGDRCIGSTTILPFKWWRATRSRYTFLRCSGSWIFAHLVQNASRLAVRTTHMRTAWFSCFQALSCVPFFFFFFFFCCASDLGPLGKMVQLKRLLVLSMGDGGRQHIKGQRF